MTAQKGRFPYDRNLGSDLYQIVSDDTKFERKVLEAIEQALKSLPEVKVYDVVITKDFLTIWVETEYGNDFIQIVRKGGS